jgi:hypothetical protein
MKIGDIIVYRSTVNHKKFYAYRYQGGLDSFHIASIERNENELNELTFIFRENEKITIREIEQMRDLIICLELIKNPSEPADFYAHL